MKYIKSYLPLVLLLLFSSVAVLPIMQQGFFPIHDNTQVARVFEMYQSLLDGLFPVRWVQDLGYGFGYPIFSFYAPFAYYIGAGLMFLGLNALDATKLMIALGVITAGVTMYYFAKEFFDKWSSLIVALLYVYAPYHAVNVFVRGAIAELWAYAFIPLAFLGFYLVAKRPSWRSLSLASFGFAVIVVSHNLTALIITPFLIGEILLLGFQYKWKKEVIKVSILAFMLGLVISAWYWLPAVAEMGYTNVASQAGGGSAYKDHFVCVSQLWNSQWGFGGSTQGCLDGLSFQLGKLHLLLGLVSSFILVFILKQKRLFYLFILISFLISVFFMLDISKGVWDVFPFMKYLQFPWRFTQPTLFFLSLLAGLSISYVSLKIKGLKYVSILAVIFLSLLIVGYYSKSFKPQIVLSPYRDETNKEMLNWTISKISDEYLPQQFIKPQNEAVALQSHRQDTATIRVLSLDQSTKQLTLTLQLNKKEVYVLPLAYFPAWKVAVDGKSVTTTQKEGKIAVVVPAGTHTITAMFLQTPLEKIANTLSVIGIVLIIIGIIKVRFLSIRE